jgi:radical SAM protein with 4Fe4S-binding SPASM domain
MNHSELDGTKIGYHLDAIINWKEGKNVFPILIEISPTNQCNHRCIFCAYEYLSRSPVHFIDKDILLKRTTELRRLGSKSLFYSGEGEPLLHKELPPIIEENAALGFDQALNTNGILLKGDRLNRILPHLSWVRVSVNGYDPASYAKIHQTTPDNFNQVIENIASAVAYKDSLGADTTIGVQLVYVGQPFDQIYNLAQQFKQVGVNYFTVKNFNQHPKISFKHEDRDASFFSELRFKLSTLKNSHFVAILRDNIGKKSKRTYKKCYALPFFAEIISNGDVYSCGPFLGFKNFCYGNINEHSFGELWAADNRKQVEQQVYQISDLDKKCMPNCRLHMINEFLWQIKHPPDHVNFI